MRDSRAVVGRDRSGPRSGCRHRPTRCRLSLHDPTGRGYGPIPCRLDERCPAAIGSPRDSGRAWPPCRQGIGVIVRAGIGSWNAKLFPPRSHEQISLSPLSCETRTLLLRRRLSILPPGTEAQHGASGRTGGSCAGSQTLVARASIFRPRAAGGELKARPVVIDRPMRSRTKARESARGSHDCAERRRGFEPTRAIGRTLMREPARSGASGCLREPAASDRSEIPFHYAKNQQVRREAVQTHRDRQAPAPLARISPSAR